MIVPAARADDSNPTKPGCYISTGDNDWLWTSPPTQSQAGIRAVFESLSKVFGCDRVYWRGIQSELIVDNFLVRHENFMLGTGFWEWERHLAKEAGTSRIAVETAHQLGLEIWGFTGLFEGGAQADSDSAKGYGPSPIEDRLRVEHPEWIPVDRAGIRRQSGPIEFAYPEARKALVKRYTEAVSSGGYDGLMFYTYVEHCAMTFEDEYGYNEPIVQEFKRRYGQDIRTERFDKHAWYRLRGEYVTQFLRELKAELKPKGRKLGVAIDPQNSHFPAPWLCIKRDFTPTGPIYMDWERWVREGIVDEIMVYCNGPLEKALNDALTATSGTPCRVSAIQGRGPAREGVRRVTVGSIHEIESGREEAQTLAALDGDDAFARMRVLEQVAQGKTKADIARLARAAKDPNVLVRRQALRALAAQGSPEAVGAIEEALDDPEHAVRCAAVEALSRVNGAESVRKMAEAVKKHGNFQFDTAVTATLSQMKADRTADILAAAADSDPRVRRVALWSLRSGESRPEALPVLLKSLSDPDAEVRFAAANALARFPGRPEAANALVKALSDSDMTVRSRAAATLPIALRGKAAELDAARREAIDKLTQIFAQFGQGYTGADREWGYRPIGNTLLALGPQGKETLEGFLRQRKDMMLADFAWKVLCISQNGYIYCLMTEEEAAKNYQRYPRVAAPAK